MGTAYPTKKQKVMAYVKALCGGSWEAMTSEEKAKEWDDLMQRNKEAGRTTYKKNPWRR